MTWIGWFTWKRCINSCSARSSVGDTSRIGDRSVTGDQSAVSGRAARGFVLCSWRRKEHHPRGTYTSPRNVNTLLLSTTHRHHHHHLHKQLISKHALNRVVGQFGKTIRDKSLYQLTLPVTFIRQSNRQHKCNSSSYTVHWLCYR